MTDGLYQHNGCSQAIVERGSELERFNHLLAQRIDARLKTRSSAQSLVSQSDGIHQPRTGDVSDNTITNPGEPMVPNQPREGKQMPEVAAQGNLDDINGSDANQEALEIRFQNLYVALMEKQISFKEAVEPFKTDNQNAGKG